MNANLLLCHRVTLRLFSLIGLALGTGPSRSFAADNSDRAELEATVQHASRVVDNRANETPMRLQRALARRAAAYVDLGKLEEASRDLNELCNLTPGVATFRGMRAQVLEARGYSDKAIKEANAAIALDPKDATLHIVLGSIFAVEKRWDEASTCATQALQLDANLASAYYLRGWVAFERRHYAESIPDLDRCLELQPYPDLLLRGHPYFMRGIALLTLRDPGRALSNLQMAQRLGGESEALLVAILKAHTKLGALGAAETAAKRLIAKYPDSASNQLEFALVHAKVGEAQAARRALEAAFVRLPTVFKSVAYEAEIRSRIGDICFALGEFQDATKHYEDALRCDGQCATALSGRAFLLACCPDAKERNGQKALALASKLRDIEARRNGDSKVSHSVRALMADAYAECGQFDAALSWARQALESAGTACGRSERLELAERIRMFGSNQAYRYAPPTAHSAND